jgi:hypothetical protein
MLCAMSLRGLIYVGASMSMGCAIQAGGGVPIGGAFEQSGAAMHVEGRVVNVVGETDGYASGQVAFANPDGGDAGFGPRQGTLGGGVRFVSPWFNFEAGGEIGAGEPMLVDFDGPGLYGGLVVSPMIRICGNQDVEPGFAAAGLLFDAGFTFRTGAWFPPDAPGNSVVAESSGQLAIRVTIISDLLDASGKEIDQ